MILFLQYLAAITVGLALGWIVWESSKMIDEKKQRQRKGLTDYYDNPIKKDK
jgi:hypothetical protein